MAKLVSKGRGVNVKDGLPIINAANELGVPFGCCAGMCGTCMVKIIEGNENLSRHTQSEKDLEIEPGFRLACQAKIKKGVVKIRF